jgi:hypothetical protein
MTAGTGGRSTETEAPGRWSREAKGWLVGLLILALVLRVLQLILLPNIHHPDEIFQVLEQANRLATGSGLVPWEFRDGIRSWILPGVLALPVGLGVATSSDPAVPALLAGIVLAFLSLTIVAAAFTAGLRLGLAHAVVAGFVAATWFELVLHGGRTLTEMVATAPLLAALALAGRPVLARRDLVAIGLLLGTVVGLRFHLGPAVAVTGLWLLWRHGRRVLVPLAVAGVVPLLVVGAVDWLTWGLPFTSILRNLQVNVIDGRSADFGVHPPWAYGGMVLAQWWLALPVIGLLALAGARRLPLWLLVAVTIVATHSLIGHKEWRFIYPAVAIGVILAAIGSVEVVAWLGRRRPASQLVMPLGLAVVGLGWTVVSIGLAARPGMLPQWSTGAATLAALHRLHEAPGMCGVGLEGLAWWETGGLVHLQRDVPLLDTTDARFSGEAVNAIIARAPATAPTDERWTQVAEVSDARQQLSVWVREGACAPV